MAILNPTGLEHIDVHCFYWFSILNLTRLLWNNNQTINRKFYHISHIINSSTGWWHIMNWLIDTSSIIILMVVCILVYWLTHYQSINQSITGSDVLTKHCRLRECSFSHILSLCTFFIHPLQSMQMFLLTKYIFLISIICSIACALVMGARYSVLCACV